MDFTENSPTFGLFWIGRGHPFRKRQKPWRNLDVREIHAWFNNQGSTTKMTVKYDTPSDGANTKWYCTSIRSPYTNFHGRILGISTQQNVLWYVFLNFRQLCCGGESACVYRWDRSQANYWPHPSNVHLPPFEKGGRFTRWGQPWERDVFRAAQGGVLNHLMTWANWILPWMVFWRFSPPWTLRKAWLLVLEKKSSIWPTTFSSSILTLWSWKNYE